MIKVLVITKQTKNISWIYVNHISQVDRKFYNIIGMKGK